MESQYNKRKKSFKKAVRFFGLLLGMAGFILACNKMDYTYKNFLKDGDIIYPGKPDSIQVFPGYKRIKLTWLLTSDPSIVMSRVYWNDKADSVNVPVTRGKGTDTISVIIDSLEEGFYNFNIYTYDKNGNSSVSADTIGQVFGDVYAASLHNRIIKKVYWDDDSAFIFWYNPSQGAVNTEITYKDNMGTTQQKVITGNDTAITLPNFRLHDGFSYRTGYMPDSLSIDTFYAASAQQTVDDTLKLLLPPFPSPEGKYAIINKNSGLAATVENAGTGNNANISQATFTGASNQLWQFQPSTKNEGYYGIINVNSGKGMAVASASPNDGANILQYKFNGGSNDQWKPEQVNGQYYKIMVLKNGKVVEVAGNSTSEDGNIQQNTYNGGDNQLFKLVWNVALGATIEGSSGGSHPASDMFDSDMSSFWQPNSSDRKDDQNVYVIIDMGTEQVINNLDQYWSKGNNHIGTYQVQYSVDGNTWKVAYQNTTGIPNTIEKASFPPVKGRYVKLSLNLKEDGNLNVNEVQVYYIPQR